MICSFQEYSDVVCGPNPRDKAAGTSILSLVSCCKDISGHCRSLKIGEIEDEVELILSRVGIFEKGDASEKTICPTHRDQYGIGWRRTSRKCAVPSSISAHEKKQEVARG